MVLDCFGCVLICFWEGVGMGFFGILATFEGWDLFLVAFLRQVFFGEPFWGLLHFDTFWIALWFLY